MLDISQAPRPEWLKSGFGKIDIVLFCLFIALVLTKSLADLDATWDSLNYHLPFAARRAGLIPASTYEFTLWLEECYRGIPAVPYYIYGFLWRVTRDINTPNIVSGLAFAGYCIFVARMFRTSLVMAAVSVAAVPVIQVSLSTVYTDLVTNVCFAGGLVLATTVLVERQRPMLSRVIGALAFVSVSANFKVQFLAIGGLFVPIFACILFVVREDGRRLLWILMDEVKRANLPTKGLLLAVGLLCYASALKNAIFYQNPFFPVSVTAFGYRILPGVATMDMYHEPHYLDGSPGILKWLLSVSEYLALGFRHVPYTLGQGDVPSEAPSLKMGGYCAAFVVYNLVVFTWTTLCSQTPRKALFWFFMALTIAVACLPGAYELRYYSFWMLYLITMNIALLWRWQSNKDGRLHFAAAAVGTFVFVASTTGWHAFIPQHVTARSRIADLDLYRLYEPHLEDGQKYCLVNWAPYPILASSFFHRDHHYAIREADGLNCPPGLARLDLQQLRAAGAAR